MQGIFIDGRRPRTKKEVREMAASDPSRVRVEATSLFPGEYDGALSDPLARDRRIVFTGPDPYKKRVFYGTITVDHDGKVVVK